METFPACTNYEVRQVLLAHPAWLTREKICNALATTSEDLRQALTSATELGGTTPPIDHDHLLLRAIRAASDDDLLAVVAYLQAYYIEKEKHDGTNDN